MRATQFLSTSTKICTCSCFPLAIALTLPNAHTQSMKTWFNHQILSKWTPMMDPSSEPIYTSPPPLSWFSPCARGRICINTHCVHGNHTLSLGIAGYSHAPRRATSKRVITPSRGSSMLAIASFPNCSVPSNTYYTRFGYSQSCLLWLMLSLLLLLSLFLC